MKINDRIPIKDLDFRIQSINSGKYATILVYKDARVDINRLNAVYGVGMWQRKHEMINGVLYCSVGVWNKEINQWCWVQDCGTESMTEKEKGQASDSFKRACFNLGIGIELYDYPRIQVKLNDNEVQSYQYQGKTKYKQSFELNLNKWKWIDQVNEKGELTGLWGYDEKNVNRFSYGTYIDPNKKEEKPKELTPEQKAENLERNIKEIQKVVDKKNQSTVSEADLTAIKLKEIKESTVKEIKRYKESNKVSEELNKWLLSEYGKIEKSIKVNFSLEVQKGIYEKLELI